MQVRQSTATTILIGPVLDANGAAKTDEGVASVKIHKNGGAAAGLDALAHLTHSQSGFYRLALMADDLGTLGTVEFSLDSGTNSMPVRSLNVLTQAAYDALHHAADGQIRTPVAVDGSGFVTLANVPHGGASASLELSGALGLTTLTGIIANITGNLSGSVGTVSAIANNAITAAAIAANAITDAKINAGAITGDKIADGAISGLKIGDGAITADKIGADAITNAKIADNAIAVENIAADAITAAKVAADVHAEAADAVWDEALAGHAGAGTAGKALSDAGAAGDPWSTALPGGYGVGTAGRLIGDNINAPIGTVDTVVDAIKAKTDNLPAAPAATGDIPTAAANADAVWDETLAGHLGVGSTGEALNAAGAAGDPWTTALPGAYGDGSAGKIIGDNINAPIATVDTVVDAIKAKTDNLPADPASTTNVSAVETKVDTVDTVADAIKAKTDNLPALPAATGDTMALGLAAIGASQIASNAFTNVKFASDAFTKVWSGSASGRLVSIDDANFDAMRSDVFLIKVNTDNLPAAPAATGDAMTLTTGERNAVADAMLDRTDGIETGWTFRKGFRLMLAALSGKLSGANTATVVIRDINDTKARITATVDEHGNRSAVTKDGD